MKLPQIHFWHDRIDDQVVAVHAVRSWAGKPSNGVFVLAVWPRSKKLSWVERTAIYDELTERLRQREAILYRYHGRNWRNHLCDRIKNGAPLEV